MELFVAIIFVGVICWVLAHQPKPNNSPQRFFGTVRGRLK